MQKLHLTRGAVDKLKATSMQSVFYDTQLNGSGLATGPGGVKTWIVWHRAGKGRRRLRRILLGTQAEMTADEAREIASRVLATSEAAEAGNKERQMPTVAQLAQDFMEAHVRQRLHPATAKSYAVVLDRVINPRIGALRIDRVTKAASLAFMPERAPQTSPSASFRACTDSPRVNGSSPTGSTRHAACGAPTQAQQPAA